MCFNAELLDVARTDMVPYLAAEGSQRDGMGRCVREPPASGGKQRERPAADRPKASQRDGRREVSRVFGAGPRIAGNSRGSEAAGGQHSGTRTAHTFPLLGDTPSGVRTSRAQSSPPPPFARGLVAGGREASGSWPALFVAHGSWKPSRVERESRARANFRLTGIRATQSPELFADAPRACSAMSRRGSGTYGLGRKAERERAHLRLAGEPLRRCDTAVRFRCGDCPGRDWRQRETLRRRWVGGFAEGCICSPTTRVRQEICISRPVPPPPPDADGPNIAALAHVPRIAKNAKLAHGSPNLCSSGARLARVQRGPQIYGSPASDAYAGRRREMRRRPGIADDTVEK